MFYEVDRTLGSEEVIGKRQKSLDMLLNHGDEPFELSFPPVGGVHPSLTLKAAVVHVFDNQDGTQQVLIGLDHMHRCCGIIHTGPLFFPLPSTQ